MSFTRRKDNIFDPRNGQSKSVTRKLGGFLFPERGRYLHYLPNISVVWIIFGRQSQLALANFDMCLDVFSSSGMTGVCKKIAS
jgi:hypothetical protein